MPDDSSQNPQNPTPQTPQTDQPITPPSEPPSQEPSKPPEPKIETPPQNAPAETPGNADESTPPSNTNKQSFSTNKFIAGGLVAAVVLAVGLTTYFAVFKNNVQAPTEPIAVASPLPKANLTVASPLDEEATTTGQILINGKATPNSLVTITGENNEEIFETDENGNFSGTFTLDEGPNEITITAFGDENEENSETRSVVYVKEEEL